MKPGHVMTTGTPVNARLFSVCLRRGKLLVWVDFFCGAFVFFSLGLFFFFFGVLVVFARENTIS